MSEIMKLDENVNLEVMTTFTKDLGMFQVKAVVFSHVMESKRGYDHDIAETELTFSINNKDCQYTGFKELYEKLYGVMAFYPFYDALRTEFEVAYARLTPYKSKKIEQQ